MQDIRPDVSWYLGLLDEGNFMTLTSCFKRVCRRVVASVWKWRRAGIYDGKVDLGSQRTGTELAPKLAADGDGWRRENEKVSNQAGWFLSHGLTLWPAGLSNTCQQK
jgi:hypothetical protein